MSFERAIAVVLLTVNSTVPGGLLFSLLAWFLPLQPSSTEKERENEKRILKTEERNVNTIR